MSVFGRWWKRLLALGVILWTLSGAQPAAAQPAPDFAHDPAVSLTLPALPARYVTVRRGPLTLAYPPTLGDLVASTLEHAEEDVAVLARQMGVTEVPPMEVRLVPDFSAMQALAPQELPPPAYASGVAYPSLRLALVATRAPVTYAAVPVRQVLRHELSHLLFGVASGNAPLPRWLTEGLAVEQASEHSFERFERLAVASYTRGVLPLRELDRGFHGHSDDAVTVAYAQSADFVGWLLRTQGADRFGVMLAHARAGRSFEEAVRESYGVTFLHLEESWRRDFDSRFALAPLWAGTGIVTLLGLVLVVWAMVRRHRKSQATRARWDREEQRRAEALRQLQRARYTVVTPGLYLIHGGRSDDARDLPN